MGTKTTKFRTGETVIRPPLAESGEPTVLW